MASTIFVDQSTVIVADWLNDVNTATYVTVPANTAAIAGKANSGANNDITSITGLTTPLAVNQGGTGATTPAGARTGLGLSIGTDVAAGGAVTSSGLTQTTNTLLGRTTAGTGAIEEIAIGSGLTFAAGSLSANTVRQIQPISASVGSNALTISASALTLDFRSTTLGSGTVTSVSGTPSNLVISSGSTLGTTNGVQSDIVVLALNNAGTIELAAVNAAGGIDLSEAGLITTTAEGGAGGADSASTIYSTTARSNVAYRVLGFIRSTQATAGTWATSPSVIQGAGGNSTPGVGLYTVSEVIPTTSGTAVPYTSIPAWAKQISVPFSTVSTSGTSLIQFQVGSGSFTTSGYVSQAWSGTGSGGVITSGIYVAGGILAGNTYTGILTLLHLGANKWVATGIMNIENATNVGYQFFGVITLAGVLDRIRITTVGGVDTFDSGSFSVHVQG